MKLTVKISLFTLCALLIGRAVFAASTSTFYELEVPFPGQSSVTDLADYLDLVIKFAIGITGILSTLMIIYGGFRWLTAMGNSGTISHAQEIIVSAVVGLILALGSYLILNFINPALTTLKDPGITTIEILGTCAADSDCEYLTCSGSYKAYCQDKVCACAALSSMTVGTTCGTDANCVSGKCRGNPDYTGGLQCSEGAAGQYCNKDEAGVVSTGSNITCQNGLTCVEREVSGVKTYVCTDNNATGKAQGTTCGSAGECASGICHSANKTCYNGDGTDEASDGSVMPCAIDGDCAGDYFCAMDGDSYMAGNGYPGDDSVTCVAKVELGDTCSRDEECISDDCSWPDEVCE